MRVLHASPFFRQRSVFLWVICFVRCDVSIPIPRYVWCTVVRTEIPQEHNLSNQTHTLFDRSLIPKTSRQRLESWSARGQSDFGRVCQFPNDCLPSFDALFDERVAAAQFSIPTKPPLCQRSAQTLARGVLSVVAVFSLGVFAPCVHFFKSARVRRVSVLPIVSFDRSFVGYVCCRVHRNI